MASGMSRASIKHIAYVEKVLGLHSIELKILLKIAERPSVQVEDLSKLGQISKSTRALQSRTKFTTYKIEGPQLMQYGIKYAIAKVGPNDFLSDLFWIGMFYHLYN
ncbi:unnamed protein product [Fraxinus pennsylvanica]|uniref:Uncharacterized protein n=1 Tax=Fraxinus pennsylvanica TaxID=56036 RepID=A0AAD2AFS6_9LAMI|nr:unnamed protein product [Fraxinus pennsylvanica]